MFIFSAAQIAADVLSLIGLPVKNVLTRPIALLNRVRQFMREQRFASPGSWIEFSLAEVDVLSMREGFGIHAFGQFIGVVVHVNGRGVQRAPETRSDSLRQGIG